ncbi:BPSS1780 family membrane protein [Lewinella sp. W8]|uniref:BPSS1780 family membrane protein n=1 Tax=Lewinella sp. W8 TaxID=2528208 RepID=UPI0010680B4D|nr:BPSS1780 family membrane protein [Lewinella sp. W8]MTB52339.1 hypothetical protein [Lewinella sp. W8]
MNYIPNQVQRAIDQDYNFRFSDYISQGFDIVKSNLGLFMGYTALFFIIVSIIGVIPFLGTLGTLVVSPCLTVGFYLAAKKTEYRQHLEFSDFFKGFDYLGPLVVAALIQFGIIMAIMIPFFAAIFLTMDVNGLDNGDLGAFPWWAFILIIPIIYLAISWSFAPLLIVFQKMKAWDALEASRKIISKQWFVFFGFILLVGLLGSLGLIILLIGILFTYPVYMASVYAAFRDIVGLPDEDGNEHMITDHFVE